MNKKLKIRRNWELQSKCKRKEERREDEKKKWHL